MPARAGVRDDAIGAPSADSAVSLPSSPHSAARAAPRPIGHKPYVPGQITTRMGLTEAMRRVRREARSPSLRSLEREGAGELPRNTLAPRSRRRTAAHRPTPGRVPGRLPRLPAGHRGVDGRPRPPRPRTRPQVRPRAYPCPDADPHSRRPSSARNATRRSNEDRSAPGTRRLRTPRPHLPPRPLQRRRDPSLGGRNSRGRGAEGREPDPDPRRPEGTRRPCPHRRPPNFDELRPQSQTPPVWLSAAVGHFERHSGPGSGWQRWGDRVTGGGGEVEHHGDGRGMTGGRMDV